MGNQRKMYETYGIELLNQKLQQPLQDIKIESFIFNDKLINKINSIYLKFDKWISLFFDDGVLFIKEGLSDKMHRIESAGDIIEYRYIDSITDIIDVEKILNKKLISVQIDEGLKLKFENQKELLLNQQALSYKEFGQTMIEIN